MSTEIILKIDNREMKCKDYFNGLNEIEYSNLVYGDFQLVDKTSNTIYFLFERKTKEDLLASIKDGRYKNQKNSILNAFQHTQYYYIIEGSHQYKNDFKNKDEKILDKQYPEAIAVLKPTN